jgi:heme-degrading monooxygenase HmoA
VVVRIWRGWTTPADAPGYVEHLRRATLPALQRLAGFEGAEILRRDLGAEVEFVIRTVWRSRDDVRAFAGEDVDAAVVPPEAESLLVRFEPTVAHYEVVPGS